MHIDKKNWWSLHLGIRYIFTFAIGSGPVTGIIIPELSSARTRAKIMSLSFSVHWVLAHQTDSSIDVNIWLSCTLTFIQIYIFSFVSVSTFLFDQRKFFSEYIVKILLLMSSVDSLGSGIFEAIWLCQWVPNDPRVMALGQLAYK